MNIKLTNYGCHPINVYHEYVEYSLYIVSQYLCSVNTKFQLSCGQNPSTVHLIIWCSTTHFLSLLQLLIMFHNKILIYRTKLLAAVLWSIWKEKNRKLFNQEFKCPFEDIATSVLLIKDWHFEQLVIKSIHSPIVTQLWIMCWEELCVVIRVGGWKLLFFLCCLPSCG